jgi:hypothetical protein
MAGRIVMYGAIGYIGGLTARAMVASGIRPVLGGRNRGRLDTLAAELSRVRLRPAGALGPAEAFGVDSLESACADAGFHREPQPPEH